MTAKWIADVRVGCVAVYSGNKRNCLSGITESPDCIFYRHGKWVETEKSGYWEVSAQDEDMAVSLAKKLNSHDALLAALKGLVNAMDANGSPWASEPETDAARAALQQVEG